MIKYIWAGGQNGAQRALFAIEVRDEYFNHYRRIEGPNCLDGLSEMMGSPVRQIISRDRGDDDVFQAQSLYRFGDTTRLIGLESGWLRCGHGAKTAGARAPLSGNHEGRGTLTPTFPAVWALSGLTDRVQLEVRNQGFSGKEDRV
jgi:hypothetical protein